MSYIITREPKKELDSEGQPKMVICYHPSVSRTRYYRQNIGCLVHGLKILSFKTEKKAKEICDVTNEMFNEDYKVELIKD